jgi:hypothetical protein
MVAAVKENEKEALASISSESFGHILLKNVND